MLNLCHDYCADKDQGISRGRVEGGAWEKISYAGGDKGDGGPIKISQNHLTLPHRRAIIAIDNRAG